MLVDVCGTDEARGTNNRLRDGMLLWQTEMAHRWEAVELPLSSSLGNVATVSKI